MKDVICDFEIRALCLKTQMVQYNQTIELWVLGVWVQDTPQSNPQLGFSVNKGCECECKERCLQPAQTALAALFIANEAWSDISKHRQ